MKYIVTGGSGFIGHNVVRQLEAQGHECYILDSGTDYGFIPKDELLYLTRSRRDRMRANTHQIDLRDQEGVHRFFSNFAFKCDAVIHLASFPRQKVVNSNPLLGSKYMSEGLLNPLVATVILTTAFAALRDFGR